MHRELCLIVQIESWSALDNIEAIAAVEGVDALFIGPYGLPDVLGHPVNPAHPDGPGQHRYGYPAGQGNGQGGGNPRH
ncbi:aldolase/citrate lyase family protein [Litchfieldella xinjiangensis]|uniref:aldolase/citrate lyase family protein n=1 Tax=Litchfieldella xinjiangensis TaxID=1166948 RepID=UPI003BF5359D